MEIQVMTDVLAKNDALAKSLHQLFVDKGIFVFNLMSSPGAGKTTILERTLEALKEKYRIAVIEGDLYTSKDAARIERLGVPVYQINTIGGCHLDAPMIQMALEGLDLDKMDLIIIENVGNLVCPAEFNIGEQDKVTVLSVTEGEDKPLKYPLIFKESSTILLNKVDLLPYIPFDKEAALRDIHNLNPSAKVFEVDALHGAGIDGWVQWIEERIAMAKKL